MSRQLKVFLDRSWTEPLPIYAWAIEHPEGVIVVDTGDTARTSEPGYLPRWHPYYRLAARLDVAPEQEIGPQLRRRGISPDDVQAVVLTHLHTDHAGGLHHFPNSDVFCAQAEYRLARGFGGRLRGYLPNRWPAWFRPKPLVFDPAPFGPFERSRALTADGSVVAVPTPGHTPGHVSVVAADDDVSYFLEGDVSYTERLLERLLLEEAVDGVSPDERSALATMRNVLRYARDNRTVYLPSHDPDSEKRLAGGIVVRVS